MHIVGDNQIVWETIVSARHDKQKKESMGGTEIEA